MIPTRLLDTNILLRLILFDDPDQSTRTGELFQQLADEAFEGLLSMTAVFETVYVLERTGYKDNRAWIADSIKLVTGAKGVRFIDNEQRYLLDTLSLYREHAQLSFADCYHAVLALAHCDGEIYTFDKEFRRVAGITRLEP
ncbi:MAG: PIN domain-containing protein [Thermomicrobiales bacterium]|nr:PIN domain-containing protein [Thermomicrobiales bacterium]MCO5219973.1 PIN domain-containing protein [Thermomicrobiales bacterium]